MEKGAGLLSSPGHPPGNLSFLEHVPVAVGWPSLGVNQESRRVPGCPESQQPLLRQVGTCPWPAVLSGPTWAGRTADITFSAQSLAGSESNAGCKVSSNNSAIKIWHLVEISIRCFSWEVWRSGCVQSTKRLRQWPRQCWGFTGQTRDLYSQPSEQKLETRPEVTTSVDHQLSQQHQVALPSHWVWCLVENILPGSHFSAIKLRRAQVESPFYFIFEMSFLLL